MSRYVLSLGLLSLVMSGSVSAELPQPQACASSPNETALLSCRKKEFADTTSLLVNDLDRLKRRFQEDSPERSRLLVSAQKAWEKYRDAECHVQTFESRGGSAFQLYELDCLTSLTRARREIIQQLLANP